MLKRDRTRIIRNHGDLEKFKFIALSSADWRFIEQKLEAKLPPNLKTQLVIITEIYAYSQITSAETVAAADIVNDLTLWCDRTAALRIKIGGAPAPNPITKRPKALAEIRQKYHRSDNVTSAFFSLASLTRHLDGAEAIGRHFIEKFSSSHFKGLRKTEMWLVWAALVIALCRAAKLPIENLARKELLPGLIVLLEKLQSSLLLRGIDPSKGNAGSTLNRVPIKTGTSLRKNAKRAERIAKDDPVDDLYTLLLFWSLGWSEFGRRESHRKDNLKLVMIRLNKELRSIPLKADIAQYGRHVSTCQRRSRRSCSIISSPRASTWMR
jgi:hypothetical protein